MKGIIYIDSHGYRVYNNNFIEYITGKTKVIDFNIKHNLLYYKNDIVNIEDYSHVYFCFRCDMIDEPINNEENPELYNELEMIIFEADWKNECNYDAIRKILIKYGFKPLEIGFQNVYKK